MNQILLNESTMLWNDEKIQDDYKNWWIKTEQDVYYKKRGINLKK